MTTFLQRIALNPHQREYWHRHSDHLQKHCQWLFSRGMYCSLLHVVLMYWLSLWQDVMTYLLVLKAASEPVELLMRLFIWGNRMTFSRVAVSLGNVTSSPSLSWEGRSSFVSRTGATVIFWLSSEVVLSRHFICVIWQLTELCMSSDSTILAPKSFSSQC